MEGFDMAEDNVFDQMGQPGESEGNEFDYVECVGFAEKFPNLNQVLFAKKNRDASRAPGRLSIFVDEGRIKVCLTAPTEGVCAFWTIETPQSVCESLEDALKKGKLDWRVDRKHKKSGKVSPF